MCWSASTAITCPSTVYRQSQIFARQGVTLNCSTVANWVGGASWWLEALRERLAAHVFASGTRLDELLPWALKAE